MTHNPPLTITIAGSTEHTVVCAEQLRAHPGFSISAVITPPPKALGRKGLITPNPLHTWASTHQVPIAFVQEKISDDVRAELASVTQHTPSDYLLVVDFGYYVPQWLLAWPRKLALNIHPSRLPEWRGSSPGQFVLLSGAHDSAVTFMVMAKEMDAGPIIQQLPLSIDPLWNHAMFYDAAFALIAPQLPTLIAQLYQGALVPQPQPTSSSTPMARRLQREDGFISWETLEKIWKRHSGHPQNLPDQTLLIPLLAAPANLATHVLTNLQEASQWSWLVQAIRALHPWPGVWTMNSDQKRIKLLPDSENPHEVLHLLEGDNAPKPISQLF